MARRPRAQGAYFHVIVRGVGKQILFEEDKDRYKFLDLLERYRDETGIVIMAYCLMENHVHLLINDQSGVLSLFMKKLGVSYAGYYNKKYDRVGHLFQDRYKSQVIVDYVGLLNVYRYILNNPVKAFISRTVDFKWSSYREFGKSNGLTDCSMIEKMFGGVDQLNDFLQMENDYEGMEDVPAHHDDEWALNVIKKTLAVESGTALQKMSKVERDEILALLKKKGLTVRQLERLTGISRSVVQRAVDWDTGDGSV